MPLKARMRCWRKLALLGLTKTCVELAHDVWQNLALTRGMVQGAMQGLRQLQECRVGAVFTLRRVGAAC